MWPPPIIADPDFLGKVFDDCGPLHVPRVLTLKYSLMAALRLFPINSLLLASDSAETTQ